MKGLCARGEIAPKNKHYYYYYYYYCLFHEILSSEHLTGFLSGEYIICNYGAKIYTGVAIKHRHLCPL